jgi:myo-inosose-2 dehydratase
MIRLGINPIGWTNDDVRWLGDDIPLDVCLAEARAAGYTGIELGRKFPRQATALKKALGRHDLVLVSGWYSARLLERSAKDEIIAMRQHLRLLKALGCTVLVFAETSGDTVPLVSKPLSERPRVAAAARWRELGRRMTEVGDYLQDQGIRLALHHHMGTPVQTAEDVDALFDHCGPSVGLLVDTGHLTFAGGEPVKMIRNHGARLAHVHAKDVRRGAFLQALELDLSFTESVLCGIFTAPGDGIVDFGAVMKELRKLDYGGWIVHEAEQDPRVANPLIYAKLGNAHLREACAEAGLKISR